MCDFSDDMLEAALNEATMKKDIMMSKGNMAKLRGEADVIGGKLKPDPKVTARVNRLLDQSTRKLIRIIDQYYRDTIKGPELRKQMNEFLTDTYDKLYRLGIEASGVSRQRVRTDMGTGDKQTLNKITKQELTNLKKLIDDIVYGHVTLARASQRAQNYMITARSIYQSAFMSRANPSVLIYWEVEPGACPDCLLLQKKSPYTVFNLPTVPKGGHTRCRQNCRCHLRMVKASPETVLQVSKKATRAKLLKALDDNQAKGKKTAVKKPAKKKIAQKKPKKMKVKLRRR